MSTPILLIIIFSCIGLLDTIYLSYHSLTKTDVYCLFFPKRWCMKVQHSKFSKTFGIPNGYLGLLMYVLILILTLLFLYASAPFWPIATLVTIGFLFSLYFLFIQAFVLRAFCTWCVVSFINFTVMAGALLYLL